MTDGSSDQRPTYNRVLLKLSGEAFAPGDAGYGIDTEATGLVARQLAEVVDSGCRPPSSWVAATSGAAARRPASTATAPTTWACSRP